MLTKEQMLHRVRRALGHASSGGAAREALPEAGRFMPQIPADDLIDHFEAEFRAVGGVPHRADSPASLRQILSEIVPPGSVVVLSRNPMLASPGIAEALASLNYSATPWPASGEAGRTFVQQCFSAAAGMTGTDFVLAESGTLALSSRTEGSQLVSLAPPIHVAFYRREQVVETLDEVLAGLAQHAAGNASSVHLEGRSLVMITGVSRTADIEQISIRGVHGPTQVHAILLT